jgi:oxygen-independent coproporphyrinogen-3 oxidase
LKGIKKIEIDETLQEDLVHRKELGLYIHIPFCIRKCSYCDFLSAPANDATKKQYIDALVTEILSYQDRTKNYTVPTIFIGGGTPSALDGTYIEIIMETIYNVFTVNHKEIEVTIEVNPGTITREKLLAYQKAGINRLSFGLQSTDNHELQLLGRIHTYEEFARNYSMAREMGFENINIDLMSALPGQTIHSWEDTLKKVIMLSPEHISAYSLIIEEGTAFYSKYGEGATNETELPSEEEDRRMYSITKTFLKEAGYERYEISNYAEKGFECKHNSSYWTGKNYLGLGLGASSLLNGVRFKNVHDIEQYICFLNEYKNQGQGSKNQPGINLPSMDEDILGIRREIERLAIEDRMEEFMFLGLRMCCGIHKKAFYKAFSIDIDHVYGKVLTDLQEKKLIVINEDNIRLTDYGVDISNTVFAEFMME